MLTQFLENYPIDLTMNPALEFWKSACMLIISGDNCYETCCRPKKIVFRIRLSNLWRGKFTSWLPRNWFELSVTFHFPTSPPHSFPASSLLRKPAWSHDSRALYGYPPPLP